MDRQRLDFRRVVLSMKQRLEHQEVSNYIRQKDSESVNMLLTMHVFNQNNELVKAFKCPSFLHDRQFPCSGEHPYSS